jgi:SH3-like domain-containing protein
MLRHALRLRDISLTCPSASWQLPNFGTARAGRDFIGIMFAMPTFNRTLVVRLVCLAGVVFVLALLVPRDFAALADISKRPSASADSAMIKKSMPLPKTVEQPTGALTIATRDPLKAAQTPVGSWVPTSAWQAGLYPVPAAPAIATDKELPAPAGLTTARIASAVNVRSGPAKSAVTLTILQSGTEVHVAETVKGWAHVYSTFGDGWVYRSYLEGGASFRPQRPKFQPTAQAAARLPLGRLQVQSAVQVRASPGGDPLYRLEPGETVRIVEVKDRWARIVTASGESGWVRAH